MSKQQLNGKRDDIDKEIDARLNIIIRMLEEMRFREEEMKNSNDAMIKLANKIEDLDDGLLSAEDYKALIDADRDLLIGKTKRLV